MSMYFVPKPCKECFGSSPAALSGPVPKAPGSAGGYLLRTLATVN
jgi:hypothetical protein